MTRPASSAHSAAWHGVHRSDSLPAASASASLPPERRGRLKNGNSPGDFLSAPRCGARTRCGGSCRQPAMKNGRCRLHGGLSTGPRTPAGLARSRRARWKHGARSAQVRALLREARLQARRTRALRARLTCSSAGHGVHRSNSPTARRAPMAKINRRDAETPRDRVGGTRRAQATTPRPSRGHSPRNHSLLERIARSQIPNSASPRLCVSAVELSFSAGHGTSYRLSRWMAGR